MMGQAALATAVGGTAGYVASLLAGAVAGMLLDQLLSPPLERWRARRRAERSRRRREARDYAGRPFTFDGVDFGVQVLFGTLGRASRRADVQTALVEIPWRAPQRLREAAAKYAEQGGFYDGAVARLHTLDVETYADAAGAEHHRLRMEIRPTGFYDMLATNVALGPFTPTTAPLLRGRGGLSDTQLSNMMGLDLTLVTVDGRAPVFFRAAGMAGLQRCWQTSSGETVQLHVDVDTEGRPDFFATARRGLEEELGIGPELLGEVLLTALVATPEYANVGVLTMAELRLSSAELEQRLDRHVLSARDNWEYMDHATLDVDDARALARALTDPSRRWTKQAAASLVFAHAYRANGNVGPLGEAIRDLGSLNLDVGPSRRGVLDDRGLLAPERTRYCWRCGAALPGRPPIACDACGQEHWDNPKPCGEAVVVHDGRVLMVQRAQAPWKACWDLPGGFCEPGEHPQHAAVRELREELGVAGRAIASLGIWMDAYGPPAVDGLIEQTANCAYLVELEDMGAEFAVDRNEILAVRWHALEWPPHDLAFPDHVEQVLAAARAFIAR